MIAFLLLVVAVIFFFSSNAKLKRYIAYTVGGLALIALVIIGFTMETGKDSNTISGTKTAPIVIEQHN